MPKILVVDDSPVQVHLLKTALQNRGFEVVSAMDAMQAGMAAQRSSPDAIVLDIQMPGGSGLEVLRRLKISTKTQHIPVIIVSGSLDDRIHKIAGELGVSTFLAKPIDTELLCRSLSALLPRTC